MGREPPQRLAADWPIVRGLCHSCPRSLCLTGLKVKDAPEQSSLLNQVLSLCKWTTHLSIPVNKAKEVVKFPVDTKDLEAIYVSKKKHHSRGLGEFLTLFSPCFKVGGRLSLASVLHAKNSCLARYVASFPLITMSIKTHALLG